MHEESFLPDTGWSLKDLTSLLFKIFCHGGLGLDIEKITHELQCHIRYDLVRPKLSWRVWGRPFLNQWHTRGISGTNGTNGCFKKNERLLSTRSVCHNSAPPLCTLLSHSPFICDNTKLFVVTFDLFLCHCFLDSHTSIKSSLFTILLHRVTPVFNTDWNFLWRWFPKQTRLYCHWSRLMVVELVILGIFDCGFKSTPLWSHLVRIDGCNVSGGLHGSLRLSLVSH